MKQRNIETHWDPPVTPTALMATTETGMYGSLRYINTAKVSSVCVCKCLCLRSLCLVPLKAIVHPVNEVFESS